MAFLIGGANSAADTGYNVANSCRFDDSASHYLTKDQSSGGSARTFTWSGWAKLADTNNSKYLFSDGTASNTSVFININSDDVIDCRAYTSGTKNWDIKSSMAFRDPSAWYHFVVRVDTTQGAANDRVRVYVNGSEIAYGTQTMPDQNYDTPVNSSSGTHRISMDRDTPSAGASHCGYISEVHFVDGASLAPASFAETDEDSGIWKPKNCKADLTYGTNGYFLEFKASAVGSGSASTIGADTSGNTNHFDSVGLAVTDQCTDTPTNNFCTLNPLANALTNPITLAEGNLKATGDSDSWEQVSSTLGSQNGKWYWEAKLSELEGDDAGEDYAHIGILNDFAVSSGALESYFGHAGSGIAYGKGQDATIYHTGGSDTSYGTTQTDDDIISVALDLTNNFIYFAKNGTWMDYSSATGDPTSGATGTGGFAITASKLYLPGVACYNSTWEMNFGNPPYAISSGNADADGYGNFEYAVPSGYYALCTKNLAEYG